VESLALVAKSENKKGPPPHLRLGPQLDTKAVNADGSCR
jgi:hypothetical protein